MSQRATSDPVDSCLHAENARFLDERDATEVCMDCGLVIDESLPGLGVRQENVLPEDNEREIARMTEKLNAFGARLSKTDQKIFLLDWADNGHLPIAVVDQTWSWTKAMLRDFNPELVNRRDRANFNFEEFSALALHQTLCKHGNPRPLAVVARITGVSQKRLWRLARIFPYSSDLGHLLPSNWMPGLSTSLPITYKESVEIGKIADMFAREFAYHPLSLLVISIYAYLTRRKEAYRERIPESCNDNAVHLNPESMLACTKSELSKMTGVALGTITRGYKRIIEENPRFNPDMFIFPHSHE